MKTAVYAGSFDPPTNGHLWVIEHGAALFDRLIVIVAVNPDKRTQFDAAERITMLQEATSRIDNVEVASTSQYIVAYAASVGATHILRGIRNGEDFEYERKMRHINRDILKKHVKVRPLPKITSVYLIPPRSLAEQSSSVVKGLIGPEGWQSVIRDYVPEAVALRLEAKHLHP